MRSNARWTVVPALFIGVGAALTACFGPPFTLRVPPADIGEGGAGAGGQGGGAAGGGHAGGGGGEAATILVIQDRAGRPVAGIDVVVNDEAGAVAQVTESDRDGRCAAPIPTGGSVSVFSAVDATLRVFIIVDPPPGSTIPVTIERPASTLPEKTSYQMVLAAVPAATDRVYVWSTCAAGPSDMLFDNELCLDSPTIDFFAVAYDAADTAIAWGAAENYPTSPGGDPIHVLVELSQTTFHVLAAEITGSLPANNHAGVTVFGDLSSKGLVTLPSPVASPPLAVTIRAPAIPGMGYRVHEFASSWVDVTGSISQIERERHHDALPMTSTFAVNSMALLSVSPLDVADPVHPELGWSVAGGARGDQGTLVLRWSTGVLEVAVQAIFAPDHPTSFRVPDIPAALSSYAPSAAVTFSKTVSVWYDDIESADGYGDVLAGAPQADGLGRIRSVASLTEP